MRYIVLWEGAEVGPVTAGEIHGMVLNGILEPGTPIRSVQEPEWSRLGVRSEFKALFVPGTRALVSTTPESPRSKSRNGG